MSPSATLPAASTEAAASTHRPGGDAAHRRPLRVLDESAPEPGVPVRGHGLPAELEHRYGGPLLVPLRPGAPTVLANFVSTIDGVVALGSGDLSGGGLISGHHEPDRFVMGLLRALADVVVIGAGTLRASDDGRWTPADVHPASGDAFAEWRRAMGLAPNPTLVVVTSSGAVPANHPAFLDSGRPVVLATTPAGAGRLARAGLPAHVTVEPVGDGERLTGDDVLAVAACRDAAVVLSEGGPHLIAALVDADRLDELFLTVAPQIVGRDGRLGLVEGVSLPPAAARWHDLASIRRSAEHLFLRYRRTKES